MSTAASAGARFRAALTEEPSFGVLDHEHRALGWSIIGERFPLAVDDRTIERPKGIIRGGYEPQPPPDFRIREPLIAVPAVLGRQSMEARLRNVRRFIVVVAVVVAVIATPNATYPGRSPESTRTPHGATNPDRAAGCTGPTTRESDVAGRYPWASQRASDPVGLVRERKCTVSNGVQFGTAPTTPAHGLPRSVAGWFRTAVTW